MIEAKAAIHSLVEEDDGEVLMREVIAENPVADIGFREEWDQQIGWHRKENILSSNDAVSVGSNNHKYIRLGKNDQLEQAKPSVIQDKETLWNVVENLSKTQNAIYFSGPMMVCIGFSLFILSVAALLRVHGLFRGRKLRSS